MFNYCYIAMLEYFHDKNNQFYINFVLFTHKLNCLDKTVLIESNTDHK